MNGAGTTARDAVRELQTRINRDIIGQERVVERIVVALLANGNVLLEGLPGLAKTRAIKSLSKNLESEFSRIQFTPDLLPSDVTGGEILRPDGQFEFRKGPIFGNLVLADEINRAPPKVQSALLEAMEERHVTVAGKRYDLPPLFMVLATQNPIEQEGTYPLPEAQMDRFLMRLQMGYPQPGDELAILRAPRLGYDAIALNPVATRSDVLRMQALAGKVFVEDSVLDYILKIITATRTEAEFKSGVSVRGGLSLRIAAQARALVLGRDFVIPEDVQLMAGPVLAHRLSLARQTSDALEERRTVLAALKRIVGAIAVPE